MKFHSLLLFLLLLIPCWLMAQKASLSGNIKDASNGEDLVGATILVKELPSTGAYTNEYGFYSLTLPLGTYTLRFQYLGFEATDLVIELTENQTLNVELNSIENTLDEVVIYGEQEDENVTSTEMSVLKLNPKNLETVPVLFGEKDLLKTIQLMPGIKSAGEGNSGFSVRGGGYDQNLILLDEAPVYNPSHLLGFFSVFNSDAIKDLTLYKGGMPAEYGGRASSVMDIIMKDGNNKKFGVSGGIGLISSKLTVEGPIVKDKGSFIISGRRTYADLFLKLSSDPTLNSTQLYFYDLNLKANYQLTERDRVYVSGYFGRDDFAFGDDFGFNWGNATGTLRWNHIFSEKLFSNTSIIYSNYDYQFSIGSGNEAFGLSSSIEDWNFKQDFSLYANAKNSIKFGLDVIHHTFAPGEVNAAEGSGLNPTQLDPQYALEGAVYIQNDQKISDRISLNYGLRYSFFNYMGPGTAYTFDEDGDISSAETFDRWESIQYYGGLEPRLSVRYQLNKNSSLKAAYNRNYQYIHLLSNSTTTTPTDTWVPSTNNVKPEIADQVAVGYFANLADNAFEFSVEAYYKNLQNQIDYRTGADLILNSTVESELVYGEGESYGLEFFLKKRKGRLTGWLSYTLSRSLRNFDAINNGNPFPARQDRIHDFSAVAMYELSPRVSLSANWVYNTGDAVTFPSGSYMVDGKLVPYYTERNGYRMPEYHRLDLGLTWFSKKTAKFESSWNFSIYNAYGRENAYAINFEENPDVPGTTQAVQLSLFKMIPSVTYNFKF